MSNFECERWSRAFAGTEYFYGHEPGPVARRAVRYHRPLLRGSTPTALDAGCGEGQDAAFLAETGYEITAFDFVPAALEKARATFKKKNLSAQIEASDLQNWNWNRTFDLVLAVNCIQFLGEDAPRILEQIGGAVASGGVLGLSLFSCDDGEQVRDGIYFSSLETLLEKFPCRGPNQNWQMLETTKLWQWNTAANTPQPFVTIIAQRLK